MPIWNLREKDYFEILLLLDVIRGLSRPISHLPLLLAFPLIKNHTTCDTEVGRSGTRDVYLAAVGESNVKQAMALGIGRLIFFMHCLSN